MLTDPIESVPNRHPQYLHHSRTIGSLLLSILLLACGGEASDTPFANNARGGAGRASNYSPAHLPATATFIETSFDSLGTGFLGSPLPISGSTMAVVAGNRRLILIRHNNLQRIYQFGEGEYPLPELASDSAARVYAVTTGRALCAIDTSGKLLWKKEIEGGKEEFDLPTWPLVLPGGIVAGTTGGVLKRFDFNGTESWSVRSGAELVRSVAFDPALGIAFGITHNDYAGSDTLVLLSEAGKETWRAPLPGLRIEYGPIIVEDRVVVGVAGRDAAGKYTPFILAFNQAGKELWRAPLKVLPLGIAGDGEGNIYVSGGGGSGLAGGIVASFGTDGKLRWETGLPESIPSAPITAGDRICFVALREQTLGLYTYNTEGGFIAFAPINSLTDITPIPVLLPYGSVVFAGTDLPILLTSR